jgi:hypothetical protein
MSSFNRRVGEENVQFQRQRAERGLRRGDGGGQQALRLEAKPLAVSQVLLKRIFPLALGEGRPLGRARGRPSPGRS